MRTIASLLDCGQIEKVHQSYCDVLVGPAGSWITEPFLIQGEMARAVERMPRRRKSKDLVEKPGMLQEDSSEGTPSLGETT